MNIIYFVTGPKLVIHMQVQFSIRTMLSQMSQEDCIYIITDNPNIYAGLKQTQTITLTSEMQQEWRGKHDFFWRIKIKAIEYIAKLRPNEDLMYVDGDTVLFGSLNEIKQKLKVGLSMMHKREGHPDKFKLNGEFIWKPVEGKTFGGITMGYNQVMWNAGVVAIPHTLYNKVFDLCLELCDGMLEEVKYPVLVEQYSLSIALEELSTLIAAEKWIVHYWHVKNDWLLFISKFFVRSYCPARSLEEELNAIRKMNFRWLAIKHDIQRRLKKHLHL